MSRAGAKFTASVGGRRFGKTVELDGIPMQPQSVQNVQRELLERHQDMLFAACRVAAWCGHFPVFRAPLLHGERLADRMLGQLELQIRERQSKIVVPKTGALVRP